MASNPWSQILLQAASNTTTPVAELAPMYAKPPEQANAPAPPPFRHAGYIPGVSELVYTEIFPQQYTGHMPQVANVVRRVLTGDTVGIDVNELNRQEHSAQREDAWRFYLGLPQANNTFDISPYQPGRSSDEDAVYYRFGQARQLQDLAPIFKVYGGSYVDTDMPSLVEELRQREGEQMVVKPEDLPPLRERKFLADPLAYFTIGLGEDEHGPYISYYDKWDFDPQVVDELYGKIPGIKRLLAGRIPGKPFEIYDRFYYDPETLEPVPGPNDPSEEVREIDRKAKGEASK